MPLHGVALTACARGHQCTIKPKDGIALHSQTQRLWCAVCECSRVCFFCGCQPDPGLWLLPWPGGKLGPGLGRAGHAS